MVLETFVVSSLNHRTRLVAREKFIKQNRILLNLFNKTNYTTGKSVTGKLRSTSKLLFGRYPVKILPYYWHSWLSCSVVLLSFSRLLLDSIKTLMTVSFEILIYSSFICSCLIQLYRFSAGKKVQLQESLCAEQGWIILKHHVLEENNKQVSWGSNSLQKQCSEYY
jgi:hypothetical protein